MADSDGYTVLMSKAQMKRIHEALKMADMRMPIDFAQYEGLDIDNLQLLTQCVGATLEEPESHEILHGWNL